MSNDQEIEKEYPIQGFIDELRRLADTLESGKEYEIELDDETILVPSHAIFSIEHESEDGRHEIEFQISWSDDEEEDDEDDADEEEEDAAA